MPRRLIELYVPGDRVEIDLAEWGWRPGVVWQQAHPGLWVRLDDGGFMFVTNRRKIRKQKDES